MQLSSAQPPKGTMGGRQLSDSRTQRHSLVTAQVIPSAAPGSSTVAPGSSTVAPGAQLLNGAAVGDLGASWESSSILGSRTNGQQWARGTNASNSSFLNRPFVPPAARSGAVLPSERMASYAQPLHGNNN
jgi:hypothetical protein